MQQTIEVPMKGERLKSSWGASVANGINALMPMAVSGGLMREGFGNGSEPLPENRRNRTKTTEEKPRQFTLRACVETQGTGQNVQYRVKVDFYHYGSDAEPVTWSGIKINPSSLQLVSGWNNAYTSEWSSSLDVDETIYLNIWIVLLEEWLSENVKISSASWSVSNTDIVYKFEPGGLGVCPEIKKAYSLGKITASGTTITNVVQYQDGAMNFIDLGSGSGSGGCGSDGDINGTNYPAPFQYKRIESEDAFGATVTSYAIVNNVFYLNGVLKTLPDYVPPATCTVYLTGTRAAPTSAAQNPSWIFALNTSPAAASGGGRVMNIKLYDFVVNQVTMDYRTTFLCLEDGVTRIKGERGNSVGTNAAYLMGEITAKGHANSGLVVKSTEDDGLVIDISGRDTSGSHSSFGVKKLYYIDGNGNEVILAKFLGTANVNIGQAAGDASLSGTILSDVSLNYSQGELTLTKTTKDLSTGETTPATSTVFTTVAHSTIQ